jgi:hypothetical protein
VSETGDLDAVVRPPTARLEPVGRPDAAACMPLKARDEPLWSRLREHCNSNFMHSRQAIFINACPYTLNDRVEAKSFKGVRTNGIERRV